MSDRLARLLLWAAVVAAALWARPIVPVDETRYLSVAWEMWLRGDWLVPHLNGEPYAHKPPLLFWLIHLGWAAFGVNEWWPRLVAPLAALVNLALAGVLSRRLFPEIKPAGVQWMLLGCTFWLWFATFVQFDLLLSACVLLGVIALVRGVREPDMRFAATLGIAIGLGVLAKGPVVLLHLGAAALAVRWACRADATAWGRWSVRVGLAFCIGAAIALAWAVPAGLAGGAAYRDAIFWGQSAHRMVDAFSHRQPWWWYLPWLPLLWFPWSLWRAWWRAPDDAASGAPARMLAVWTAGTVLVFSLISAKQVKYLLPVFPAVLLWMAARASVRPAPRAAALWLAAVPIAAAGALLAAIPFLEHERLPEWAAQVSPWAGASWIAAGLALPWWGRGGIEHQVRALALCSAFLVISAHIGVLRPIAPAYDLRPISRALADAQRDGRPIAHVGKYHGQYHFLGRLRAPLAVLDLARARAWAQAHPNGLLVVYTKDRTDPMLQRAEFRQVYRSGYAALVGVRDW